MLSMIDNKPISPYISLLPYKEFTKQLDAGSGARAAAAAVANDGGGDGKNQDGLPNYTKMLDDGLSERYKKFAIVPSTITEADIN